MRASRGSPHRRRHHSIDHGYAPRRNATIRFESMDLQRISVKLYTASGAIPQCTAFTAVFHDWIQRDVLPGMTCIDVADYSHVSHGPGMLLVAHEGHYAMEQGDTPGLRYANKRGAEGSVADRFRSVLGRLVHAASLIEQASVLNPAVKFDPSRVRFVVEDRLLAPNTAEAYQAVADDVHSVSQAAFGDGVTVQHMAADKGGLTIDVAAATTPSIAELVARCE